MGEDDVTATNQPSEGTPLIVPITLTPVNDAPEFAGKQELIGKVEPYFEGSTTTIGGSRRLPGPTVKDRLIANRRYRIFVYQDPDNTTEQRQHR